MMSSALSDEQKRKIEESKRKALALRQAKLTARNSKSWDVGVSSINKIAPKPLTNQSWNAFQNKASVCQAKPSITWNTQNKIQGVNSTQSTNKQNVSHQSSTVIKAPFIKQTSYNPNQSPRPSQSSLSAKINAASSASLNRTNLQALVTADPSPVKRGCLATAGTCRLISQERFLVDVGYSAPLVEVFKSMSTKAYDPKTKNWNFHLNEYPKLMQHIKGLGSQFQIEPLAQSAVSAFSGAMQGKTADRHVPEADLSNVDSKLADALMPFQREGVNFVIHRKGRALIADDMGLGKTLQALCVMSYYRSEWPVLIVVPSSVRFAWREQILAWLPSVRGDDINVTVTSKDSSTSALVNIISYDLMVKQKTPLRDKRFQVVIMDESHSLKNVKTARTQAAIPILKSAKRVILLSGTPALSRPSELFTQISVIDSTVFPKFHDFGVRYCNGKKHAWGWDFSGSSNLSELQLILEEKIMIRRLKSDVMSQLPSKCRQMVVLNPSSVKVSSDMKRTHHLMTKLKGMEQRGALLEYFHETGACKASAVREYVLDLLENDRKLLLFAHHQSVLDAVEEAVGKKHSYIRIDGTTNSEQRSYLSNKFQRDDNVKIAILSIMAANSGLNLTAASLVVFAELFWNPGILMQAEDRAHRIGQEDNVTIHYLIAKGTADDYLWPLVQQKLDVLGRAGLSKDNMSEMETKIMENPKQRQIMEFFEESFKEELNSSGCKESLSAVQNGVSESGKETKHGSNSSTQQSNLFNYFKSSASTSKPTCDTSSSSYKADSTCERNYSDRQSSNQTALSPTEQLNENDWFDDMNEEFWVTEVDPDAPWPPKRQKSTLK